MISRRLLLILVVAAPLVASIGLDSANAAKKKGVTVMRFCRFRAGDTVAYGVVEGDRVRQLSGDLFGAWNKTDKTYALDDVKLLVPTRPTQILALAGNYRSHLVQGESIVTTVTTVTKISTNLKTNKTEENSQTTVETVKSGEVPVKLQTPQPFFKSPSSLVANGENIVIPSDAEVVHYEAEMVIVIGRTAKNVSRDKALDYVFGVTCGNDVSARVWQKGDVQWWRAKGSDTFSPCGPFIATGLNYDDLLMQLRLNGKVRQQDRTSSMIHDVAGMVSFISRHITLHPGDLIYTGTTGQTSTIKPGDVVEVEIEGVGVLRNPVVAER
jgi:2-keto-4-pentenoate hydratase/2-oxohepta-3-ene-1,7-dioic acid hydratase in catechol pathway